MERSGSIRAADGVSLGYRVWRTTTSRPVLVMIHGLASNLTRWSEFVAHTSLKHEWDLLRIDLRGHGSSMTRSRFSREQWCADLAAVLRAEGYGQAIVAGHSLGAEVALDFAVAWPQMARGLILIDPVFPEALRGRLKVAKRLVWLNRWLIGLLRLANRLGLRRSAFPYRDLRALDERTRAVLAADPHADIAKLYTKPSADLRYMPLANYLQDLYEVVRPLPPLESITQPVLVLLSAGASTSSADVNRRMISRLANCETVEINADHWLLTERPVDARRAIEAWCGRMRWGAAGRK